MENLKSYLKQLRTRTPVVSIDYILGQLEHADSIQTHRMAPSRHFQTTEEHLHIREQTRLYGANTRVN